MLLPVGIREQIQSGRARALSLPHEICEEEKKKKRGGKRRTKKNEDKTKMPNKSFYAWLKLSRVLVAPVVVVVVLRATVPIIPRWLRESFRSYCSSFTRQVNKLQLTVYFVQHRERQISL